MNQVALVGRMTKDPILRRLSEGRLQTSFILAVNRKFKNQQGEVDADFILCTAWGKVAENTAKHCGKGSLVGVGGRIQSRTYEREDNTRVFVTEVMGKKSDFYRRSDGRAKTFTRNLASLCLSRTGREVEAKKTMSNRTSNCLKMKKTDCPFSNLSARYITIGLGKERGGEIVHWTGMVTQTK